MLQSHGCNKSKIKCKKFQAPFNYKICIIAMRIIPILSHRYLLSGFGIGDAYMCAVTRDGNFYVYSFCDLEGWKMEATGVLIGLQNLVPFELNEKLYLFAPSSKISSLLTVMKHSNVHEP